MGGLAWCFLPLLVFVFVLKKCACLKIKCTYNLTMLLLLNIKKKKKIEIKEKEGNAKQRHFFVLVLCKKSQRKILSSQFIVQSGFCNLEINKIFWLL